MVDELLTGSSLVDDGVLVDLGKGAEDRFLLVGEALEVLHRAIVVANTVPGLAVILSLLFEKRFEEWVLNGHLHFGNVFDVAVTPNWLDTL